MKNFMLFVVVFFSLSIFVGCLEHDLDIDVTGHVYDKETNEPIEGVEIRVDYSVRISYDNDNCVTNEEGYYKCHFSEYEDNKWDTIDVFSFGVYPGDEYKIMSTPREIWDGDVYDIYLTKK